MVGRSPPITYVEFMTLPEILCVLIGVYVGRRLVAKPKLIHHRTEFFKSGHVVSGSSS